MGIWFRKTKQRQIQGVKFKGKKRLNYIFPGTGFCLSTTAYKIVKADVTRADGLAVP